MRYASAQKLRAAETPAAAARRTDLIRDLIFEIIPMKTASRAAAALPAQADVSVTCSPRHGFAATQRLVEELLEQGSRPIPHLAARQVEDRQRLRTIAAWLRATGVKKLFVVAGDAPEAGQYRDSIVLLEDLLGLDHGLDAIGVTGYPDGHPLIDDGALLMALERKQTLLQSAQLRSWCSTQMCFDPAAVERWIRMVRAEGLTMPIHLGIPGVIDRTKLITMGARLGVGTSIGYLRKNRSVVASLLRTRSYDPGVLLLSLSGLFAPHDVEALHVFTFNQVEATNSWRLAAG